MWVVAVRPDFSSFFWSHTPTRAREREQLSHFTFTRDTDEQRLSMSQLAASQCHHGHAYINSLSCAFGHSIFFDDFHLFRAVHRKWISRNENLSNEWAQISLRAIAVHTIFEFIQSCMLRLLRWRVGWVWNVELPTAVESAHIHTHTPSVQHLGNDSISIQLGNVGDGWREAESLLFASFGTPARRAHGEFAICVNGKIIFGQFVYGPRFCVRRPFAFAIFFFFLPRSTSTHIRSTPILSSPHKSSTFAILPFRVNVCVCVLCVWDSCLNHSA